MKVLLVYYHPVVLDLARTFDVMGYDVTVAVNPKVKDNYGKGDEIIKAAQARLSPYNIDVISLHLALAQLNQKKYDLVGCDGVFDGDSSVIGVCERLKTPFFCIQGYPNVLDEPSKNILSLGWFTPTVQYNQKYPSEGHKKQIDWKEISDSGRSAMKNFCVFYPNFWDFKEYLGSNDFSFPLERNFVSLIQGYKKWNLYSYEVFNQVKSDFCVNLEGKSTDEVRLALSDSYGLLHCKWADQPGIGIFEAMLFSRPVLTMSSFIYSSMNPEVLIHNYNSFIADSVEELQSSLRLDRHEYIEAGQNARAHALMLTDFDRQKNKLQNFIERALKEN